MEFRFHKVLCVCLVDTRWEDCAHSDLDEGPSKYNVTSINTINIVSY